MTVAVPKDGVAGGFGGFQDALSDVGIVEEGGATGGKGGTGGAEFEDDWAGIDIHPDVATSVVILF